MTITLEAPAAAPAVDISDIVVPDDAVLAISVRLHDQKCRQKDRCRIRDWHALDSFGRAARNFLTIHAEASRAGEI